jgi:hypothetical protein
MRISLAAIAGVLVLTAMSVVSAPVANADTGSVPFVDKKAQGYIGFCDDKGHQITSGSLTDRPFAWRAVSSTPAPTPYFEGGNGRVELAVYQPIQGVPPGLWTGKAMSNTSAYSDAKYPTAAGTFADPALFDFWQVAPSWDGLYQFRMIFTAINLPIHNRPYPAAVIQVKDGHWKVVGPFTSVPCGKVKAISDTEVLLPSSIPTSSPTPQVAASAIQGNGNSGQSASTNSVGSTPSGNGSSAGDSSASPATAGDDEAGSTGSASNAAASSQIDSSGLGPWQVLLLLLGVLGMGLLIGWAVAKRARETGD